MEPRESRLSASRFGCQVAGPVPRAAAQAFPGLAARTRWSGLEPGGLGRQGLPYPLGRTRLLHQSGTGFEALVASVRGLRADQQSVEKVLT